MPLVVRSFFAQVQNVTRMRLLPGLCLFLRYCSLPIAVLSSAACPHGLLSIPALYSV